MKNLQDYLDPQYSWWILSGEDEEEMVALNPEIKPTDENLRIIFSCNCSAEYHVAELKDIKLHEDGDYDFCCPESGLGRFESYVSPEDLPACLKEIFSSDSFEKNYEESEASEADERQC